jgi:crossover junction endodeoxyribonuclease RusA
MILMDILISKRNNYDIDGLLKLLFDSLNGLAYIDDKQIVDLRVRKHLNEIEDKLIIKIEEV